MIEHPPCVAGVWRRVDLAGQEIAHHFVDLHVELAGQVAWVNDDEVIVFSSGGHVRHVVTPTLRGYGCCCTTYGMTGKDCVATIFVRMLAMRRGDHGINACA